jgi:hypothetical protein
MLAEGLPHQPLQAVPFVSLSAVFPGYRQPQPGLVAAVFPGQDRKQIVATPAGFGKHMAERICIGQAVGFGEPMSRRRNRAGTAIRPARNQAVFVLPRFVRCVRFCWILRSDAMRTGDSNGQGVSCARPFARRRLSTRRPALVAMRARNPWVLARFKLPGWNVRFIVV